MFKIPQTHYEAVLNLGVITKGAFDILSEKYQGKIPDFIEFCEMVNTKSREHYLNPMSLLSGNMYEETMLVYSMSFHTWRFRECGEKVFYINEDICRMISGTKLTIGPEFIESPFESIYLYTDQSDITLTDSTGTKPMKGMYVHLRKESDGVKKLRFLATSGAEGIINKQDVNHFASFYIQEEGDADDICEAGIKRFFESYQKTGSTPSVSMDAIRLLYKFAVGTLIYIGCRNANFVSVFPEKLSDKIGSLKNPKKIRRIEKEHGKHCQLPFIWVGHKTHYPTPGCLGAGKKLDHSVLVSGHWRGQWSGPMDGERRKEIIRIDSYTKGKRFAEGEKKAYILKE